MADRPALRRLTPNVQIAEHDFLTGCLTATMRTNLFELQFGVRRRPDELRGYDDSCIVGWTIADSGNNLVEAHYLEDIKGLDGSTYRPLCSRIDVVSAQGGEMSVRLSYNSDEFVSTYTLRDDLPAVQIDYLIYGTYRVFNVVDIGTPGGVVEKFSGATRVLGQESWTRPIVYHERPYWNVHVDERADFLVPDAADAGSLNYRGYMIMAAGKEGSGWGLGRAIQIYRQGEAGGIRCVKLLWDTGFETFPCYDVDQERRPFRSFLFAYSGGFDEAMRLGCTLVDRFGDRS
ncbi:MAG: hypothetical protein JNL14_14500 [Devosia sp.]|uniref:hypothetical protein n=1 Tax=Devosia sp. TaxID=1871048 RepID=UPI001A4034F2|nr:hypothetical protein [Devosia sp.]MBL8598942.1 hypothetical protein [Devosia sp.]